VSGGKRVADPFPIFLCRRSIASVYGRLRAHCDLFTMAGG